MSKVLIHQSLSPQLSIWSALKYPYQPDHDVSKVEYEHFPSSVPRQTDKKNEKTLLRAPQPCLSRDSRDCSDKA